MPKVSFVLPAYKRRFLHEAIASILAQTCRDFELVIVDDCSPENLKEVVDTFYDKRITYYRNEKNLGGRDLVAAWNHAIEYARGEWCVLASDDDVYEKDYLQEMMDLSVKYPDVELFHCRVVTINENGILESIRQPRCEYETGIEMTYNRGILYFGQSAPEFMFKLSSLKKAGGFVCCPKAWFSDDATWMLLSLEHGVVCSQRPLLRFRMSGINISSMKSDLLEKLKAVEIFRGWMHEHIDKLIPNTEVDHLLLSRIKNGIDVTLTNYARVGLRCAPLMLWVRIMCDSKIVGLYRVRAIKDKVLFLLNKPFDVFRSLSLSSRADKVG